VHEGHIWHVVVGSFEAPDGEPFTRDIVRSPGAVGAVPLHDDGTVTLVRQYRPPFDRHIIEIPAGMRDVTDEPVETTARRELVEEVGIEAARLELLTEFLPSAGMTDSVLHVFLATGLSEVGREVHGPEESDMEVLRMPLEEAVAMVVDGRISDAKTVIGLLLTDRHVRNER
jgi:8-oxo-dGTP pyrophosphatase MutT (NUDIX family)